MRVFLARDRIAAAKAAKEEEKRKQIIEKFGSVETWMQIPRELGGGNPRISKYSYKNWFPGSVKSQKSGGYYDPHQWEH